MRFARRLLLPLLLLAVACGDDVSVFIHVSFGTIVDDASCSGGSGRFRFEESGGLVVTVFVTEDTQIVRVAFDAPAGCSDLVAGEQATVTGDDEDGTIHATKVEIGNPAN